MKDTKFDINFEWCQEHRNGFSYQPVFGRPEKLVTFHESVLQERLEGGTPRKHPFSVAVERNYLISKPVEQN